MALIQAFRKRLDPSQPLSVSRAKVLDPSVYERLVAAVEEQLYRFVLLKLQTVAGTADPFLYELPASADPRGEGSPALFSGGLRLRPGTAAYLVRFEPLLRPLIQQRWAQHVAGLRSNAALRHEYELEVFLFGSERISLGSVTAPLAEVQDGRCFYCERKVAVRAAHVDHFIPWSRYRDNGLENLVYVDGACNARKQAYLAGRDHLATWLDRFRSGSPLARDLAEIGARLKWERHPARTRGAAQTAYLYATPATLFWGHRTGLRREDPEAIRRLLLVT